MEKYHPESEPTGWVSAFQPFSEAPDLDTLCLSRAPALGASQRLLTEHRWRATCCCGTRAALPT